MRSETVRHADGRSPDPEGTGGAFITLEGIDGCGKSTQTRLLARALELAGYDVLQLREPGGTRISEKIRGLLLDPENGEMGDVCELLLYEAARAQLVHERIAPAISEGRVVVCDRFYDSTTCYQAFAGGVDRAAVDRANELAVGACRPDLTLVFDLDPAVAAARTGDRVADRMEAKGLEYQQRVAAGFRAIAAEEPGRVRLIDAAEGVEDVLGQVVRAVSELGLDISAVVPEVLRAEGTADAQVPASSEDGSHPGGAS